MARGVKNPSETQETQEIWVWSLGQEGPLEEEMATHSSIINWKTSDRAAWGATVMRSQRVGCEWATKHACRNGKPSTIEILQTSLSANY